MDYHNANHLSSLETAEMSITAVETALPVLSPIVHSLVITTPTESHFHKSICLIIAMQCCKHLQSSQGKVHAKYCSIKALQ